MVRPWSASERRPPAIRESNWFGMDVTTTVTDGQGRYQLEHLTAGEYILLALPSTRLGARRDDVRVSDGNARRQSISR